MSTSRLASILTLQRWLNPPPVVAVVRLQGVIAPGLGFRTGLSLALLAAVLHRAFSLRGAKAVALSINSPGGSPVQSALIAQRIRALATQKNLPVYAFVEDVAASGGYWLATAADEIYADPNSIVGSIGVVSAGFGLDGFIQRHGIERRLHVSGERKAMLDPFMPERPDDVARLQALQAEIHGNFKAQVRARRGLKLKGDDALLFSGEFWTGRRARELGLIDGLGDLRSVMREHYGERVQLRVIGARRRWWVPRLWRSSAEAPEAGPALTAGLAEGLLAAIEDRAWWSRYGL